MSTSPTTCQHREIDGKREREREVNVCLIVFRARFGLLRLVVDLGREHFLIVDGEAVPFQLGRRAIPNVGNVNDDRFDAGRHGLALVCGLLAAVVELQELKPAENKREEIPLPPGEGENPKSELCG